MLIKASIENNYKIGATEKSKIMLVVYGCDGLDNTLQDIEELLKFNKEIKDPSINYDTNNVTLRKTILSSEENEFFIYGQPVLNTQDIGIESKLLKGLENFSRINVYNLLSNGESQLQFCKTQINESWNVYTKHLTTQENNLSQKITSLIKNPIKKIRKLKFPFEYKI